MLKSIDNDLSQVKDMVIDMMNLTIEQYKDMYLAIQQNDYHIAQTVMDNDYIVNQMNQTFMEVSLWKIAKQQMVARDLRRAIGFIQIVRDIEEIADYSRDICRYLVKYQPNDNLSNVLETMLNKVLEMFESCKNVFVNENIDLAYNLFQEVDDAGKIYKNQNYQLLDMLKQTDNEKEIKLITRTMQQLKLIERAGDHLENIAEMLVYIKEGKMYEYDKPID